MRKITLLAAFVFILKTVTGQTTITGTIRDAKIPVSGATIAIRDSYDGTTTDSTGKFSFRTSEKGEQILVISAIGYKTFEQKLNLNGTPQNLTRT